ncbi:hypothetical protein AVEN_151679-1, partial [Araneus ventricosus]
IFCALGAQITTGKPVDLDMKESVASIWCFLCLAGLLRIGQLSFAQDGLGYPVLMDWS